MYWVSVAIAAAVVLLATIVALLHLRIRRKRMALLKDVCETLGCTFHADSFRGRFLSRAVRGDGVDELPRKGMSPKRGRLDGLVVSVMYGAVLAARAMFGALSSSAKTSQALRIRLELCSVHEPSPDGAKAAAALRAELKRLYGGPPAFDVTTLGGTEVVIILRGEAATADTVKKMIELAIGSSAAEAGARAGR
jgi:hypothetical protein